MKIRQTFYLNEEEGGSPEVGPYDIGLRSIPPYPNNTFLPYQNSGVTRGSFILSTQYGLAAEGLGSVQPTVIPDYFYFGVMPITHQPLINKPNPYEE